MAVLWGAGGSGCALRTLLHTTERTLDDDLRVVLGGGGNSLVLLHGADALVVDPKFLGYARGLERQVEERWGRRVRRVVLTHFHSDHANGAALFEGAGAVLVQPSTKGRLVASARGACAARPRTELEAGSGFEATGPTPFARKGDEGRLPLCALPFVEVRSEMKLWLGEEVRVVPLTGHTDGDVVVYLPERRVLAAGDLALNGWMPRIDPAAGGNALQMMRALERMLEWDVETVVPGHGEVGGREVLLAALEYLKAVEADVRAALAQGAATEAEVAAAVPPMRTEHKLLRPIPGDSHERTVRLMYRAIAERP